MYARAQAAGARQACMLQAARPGPGCATPSAAVTVLAFAPQHSKATVAPQHATVALLAGEVEGHQPQGRR